jgi:putative ABC transport system permease protein
LIAADFANYRPVAVIDRLLADQLFPKQNPIGQSLDAIGSPCVVVGVMETKLNFNAAQTRGQLFVPLSLVAAVTGSNQIDRLNLRPANLEAMKTVEAKAKQILEQRYPGGDVRAYSNVSEILAQRQTPISISWALLAVAGIALLVGGVGIANITIAEVMERRQEIGLRRAIGATRGDIMLQFILEAAILSAIGGVAAIGAVHGITGVVAKNFNLPYEFNSNTAILSLTTALLVGVGAGYFPARQASYLDPLQALRSD